MATANPRDPAFEEALRQLTVAAVDVGSAEDKPALDAADRALHAAAFKLLHAYDTSLARAREQERNHIYAAALNRLEQHIFPLTLRKEAWERFRTDVLANSLSGTPERLYNEAEVRRMIKHLLATYARSREEFMAYFAQSPLPATPTPEPSRE